MRPCLGQEYLFALSSLLIPHAFARLTLANIYRDGRKNTRSPSPLSTLLRLTRGSASNCKLLLTDVNLGNIASRVFPSRTEHLCTSYFETYLLDSCVDCMSCIVVLHAAATFLSKLSGIFRKVLPVKLQEHIF